MKKTLISAAVICAVCGSAYASDVTLYGVVDTGLSYTYSDDDVAGESADHAFEMGSGQTAGSRFGLKGTEDVAEGFKVGFVLENGFESDTGALSTAGKIFDREAQLFIDTTYGKLSFGRVGLLHSDAGSFGMMGDLSTFGTGWGDIIGNQNMVFAYKPARMDNTVTYVSPDIYGLKIHAQYSMGTAAAKGEKTRTQVENESSTNRYFALGASYKLEALEVYGLVDYVNKASYSDNTQDSLAHHGKDQYTVTLGGNYDFDVAKVYFAAQYFDNATEVGGEADETGFDLAKNKKAYGDIEGYGIVAGTAVPVCGGSVKFSAGYMHAESDKTNKKANRWMAGAGYQYPISKRTNLYTGVGYVQDSADNRDPYAVQAIAGLKHNF